MNPDTIPPEVGLPLGAILWAIVLVPPTARYLRARRLSRKESR